MSNKDEEFNKRFAELLTVLLGATEDDIDAVDQELRRKVEMRKAEAKREGRTIKVSKSKKPFAEIIEELRPHLDDEPYEKLMRIASRYKE